MGRLTMNQRKVILLGEAKFSLPRKMSAGICREITRACNNRYGVLPYREMALWDTAARQLKHLICNRLRGRSFLSGWLFDQGILKDIEDLKCPEVIEKIQTTRIAWIDALIKEHSE